MRYEVENSGLEPTELKEVLPDAFPPFQRETGGTGHRGVLLDTLVGVGQNLAAGGVTALLAAAWVAVRRRRERELRDTSAAVVRVELFDDEGAVVQSILELRGDGGDVLRTFEVEVGPLLENGRLQRVRITFPRDR
ncbi:hypothetical protein JCM4814A_80840 [Streptomyces phaeofaciens JCM 4814]|uniref:Uncharacterized protein n=1 Tax=Streptomyces phaeofaciens TaxID=68254 RepID=A0A918M1J2_9ACTN|nr:hypothetical protein [Streptomyces phaeofaciens]GGT95479.1 hypothetical protein GCM10010226_86460 [Streptomyces phaeofaciens]